MQRLTTQQRLAGWSDRQMARELGVSASLWTHTRKGRCPVGLTLLRAAGHRFPELAGDILGEMLPHPPGVGVKPRVGDSPLGEEQCEESAS